MIIPKTSLLLSANHEQKAKSASPFIPHCHFIKAVNSLGYGVTSVMPEARQAYLEPNLPVFSAII